MASKRVNVLVYAGTGATAGSVRHCLYTLRRLLSPNYAVIPVNGDAIIKEPWTASCALLVFPGGADLGYCRTLNGEGNRRIIQYVNRGGAYLGFCSGGYYGSKRCEFEVGDPKMEVVGERELAFFPGVCRGLAFPGFLYHSEAGARAAELRVNRANLPASPGTLPETFRSYYNGGGVFVDAEKYADRGVEILASYTEELRVDAGPEKAAVVYRKVGDGGVILTGPHPEFAAVNLSKQDNGPEYAKVVDAVAADEKPRTDFLKACLTKLGLKVNQEEQAVPSLSRLHLSTHKPSDVAELVSSWQEIITLSDGEEYIKGENDTFHLEKPDRWSMSTLTQAVASVLPGAAGKEKDNAEEDQAGLIDYDKVVKRIVAHETELPSNKETPYFNHYAYFANLQHYQHELRDSDPAFGKYILYGEVVTSTNTLLEKNPALLSHLPPGFTAAATTQIAGRGRGTNVWVAPPGALMFSTVLRHPLALTQSAPVVFLQYLAALAIVEGIQSYEPGYAKLPVKLKWPNDIYALDPSVLKEDGSDGKKREAKDYVKIGGILVTSSYAGGDYTCVVGIGINVANAAPTTSLDALATKVGLKRLQMEKLLARILVSFEAIYGKFCRSGWNRELEEIYYRNWLHTDQIVTLESAEGQRARIKGITRDWGLLLAEELGREDRNTGKVWQLQSDSNSFDFFKGLVKRKV
ncbi:biotin-[acetyl-CoA-carboxylase] ligase [Coniosporium apollinis CBS 100218]|uniref:Biotin-[acetyl-CoA-carboxylase] ligase n=1 Tax=Coniosporium apollinis (strain CBS 100218) TaxID=1168221 RepID=R7Z147_CONA1|nr:biotin-[acetyl-CoA-carboxylase] ligase [Coniosporium apollinis CBS 100218]EON67818.1 biotin-[acetyl-CoA-carboxylase] ligase [Coniosporium apollinis CBS 100218]